ncbi:MAG TPA: rhodanese-like domain-containing protein [Gammaproteobacteria bacterium]|nr:rhodanese-like domain-containing protein [Gammaproteobacteria bacterium]
MRIPAFLRPAPVWGLVLMLAAAPAAAGLPPIKTQGGYTSPERIEGATTVSPEEAHRLWQQGVTFVDPRSGTDWVVGHIPKAVHIVNDPGGEPEELSPETLAKAVAKDDPVLFYCNGPECDRSSNSAAKAVKWGWTRVYYFRGGFPAWQDAGYPIKTSDKWPDKTRGTEYYKTHPQKARWISNQCDRISAPAMTDAQQKHCTEAKIGLLQFLSTHSGGGE